MYNRQYLATVDFANDNFRQRSLSGKHGKIIVIYTKMENRLPCIDQASFQRSVD